MFLFLLCHFLSQFFILSGESVQLLAHGGMVSSWLPHESSLPRFGGLSSGGIAEGIPKETGPPHGLPKVLGPVESAMM